MGKSIALCTYVRLAGTRMAYAGVCVRVSASYYVTTAAGSFIFTLNQWLADVLYDA